MNSFGYRAPKPIRDFEWLSLITKWAGTLGLLQSLVWIGLSVSAILSYYCIIGVEPASYGSLVGLAFVDLYFRGECIPNGMLGYDFQILHSVDIVQDPQQLFIWEIVYLVVAVLWFFASFFLLTQLRKTCVPTTSGVMITWIIITLLIIILDTALGVIFSIDYSRFHEKAYTYNYSSLLSGAVTPAGAQLLAGYIVDLLLIFISFKFFFLYLINFGFVIYLWILVARMYREKDANDTLYIVRKDSNNILDRPPIHAYDDSRQLGYVNESYLSESVETVELNQDAIIRAARMSNDVTSMDRRFRNLEAYQQYPPQRFNGNMISNNNNNNSNGPMKVPASRQNSVQTQYPAPDYTPPMSRGYRGYN